MVDYILFIGFKDFFPPFAVYDEVTWNLFLGHDRNTGVQQFRCSVGTTCCNPSHKSHFHLSEVLSARFTIEIPQKYLWIDCDVIFAWISWEFDKHLSEIMISRLWLDMIICNAIYHLGFKSMHYFCHAWLPVITKQDISTRKCTSRDADLKVQVPSFQVVKGHLLQTCSFQLWEALDGNRLKPHALPQHGGPRMVTLRKRKTVKESRSEQWTHYFQSQQAFLQSLVADQLEHTWLWF